jgi:hypothetical protein
MLALALAAVVAAPFTDTQDRFTIDLPEGWSFAPQPGDVTGAAFQRKTDNALAVCVVKILPVADGVDLAMFTKELTKAVKNEKGYKQLIEELDTLGGLPAVRRRYIVFINGDPKLVKMAEDKVALADGRGFIIHMETLADAFPSFEADFDELVASFRPKNLMLTDSPAQMQAQRELFGRWAMKTDPSTVFDLRSDGTFDLAGAKGVWKVENNQLVALAEGGGEERFRYVLKGASLELRGAGLPEPILYVKQTPAAEVTGKWASEGHRLQLGPGKSAMLDQSPGTFSVKDGAIELVLGKKKQKLTLRYRLDAGRLVLDGGPFQNQALERAP